MNVTLTLSLPRDARYVPLVRDLAASLLADIEVAAGAIDDVLMALAEVCANAVRQAAGAAEYAVTLAVDDSACEVEVVDLGPGFELALTDVADHHESGRGLHTMRALLEDLRFLRDPAGMRVRLYKRWEVVAFGARSQGHALEFSGQVN